MTPEECATLIRRLHEEFDHCGGGVGAALHIVTDDQNIDDGSIAFCARAIGNHWSDIPPPGVSEHDIAAMQALERQILDALRGMSKTQRRKAVGG